MSKFSKIFIAILVVITVFYLKENIFDNYKLFNKFHKEPQKSEQTSKQTIESEKKSTEENKKPAVKADYVYVYFLGVDKDGNGVFKKVKRPTNNKSKLETAISELLKGPNYAEKKHGVYDEIPKGTRLLSIKQNGNNVIINLSSDFQYGGGTDSIYSRMRQLIKTSLANAPHKNIYLYLDGKQVDVLGGEGIMISQPLSENSLDD